MARYIDADALIQDFKRQYKFLFGDDSLPYGLENGIKTFPTADVVEVVHGKWIHKGDEVYCSECKFRFYPVMFKYCPGCGAKMEVC